MPVRSSTSSVLRWPDAAEVREALVAWARDVADGLPSLRRVGYFGSYAQGHWGPGSDLDILVVVERSNRPFIERGAALDVTGLPVPTQSLVSTHDEWRELHERGGGFAEALAKETVWIYEREG